MNFRIKTLLPQNQIQIVVCCIFIINLSVAYADFRCKESKILVNKKDSTCKKELQCSFNEFYKEIEGFTRHCRCKTVIENEPIPTSILSHNMFFNICSRFDYFLQELWVVNANVEQIDNTIFERYKNLKSVYLFGNNLILNFTNQAKNLKILDISLNRLTNVQSKHFDNLQSLIFINASYNKIKDLNNCFKNVKMLEEVHFTHNELTHINKDDFDHLAQLKIINLAHNLLTIIKSSLHLPKLRQIFLSHNKLKRLNEEKSINLPNLEDLDISHNLFTNIDQYNTFGKLENFLCQSNNFQSITNNIFQSLTNLKLLNFSDNKIESIDKGTFSPNTKLNIADFSSNSIKHIDSDNFKTNFKNLTYFNLNNNSLTEKVISCNNIKHMSELSNLQLSANHINMLEECIFDNLKKLQNLSLMANKLHTLSSKTFKSSSKLSDLDLSKNQITSLPDDLLKSATQIEKLNISSNKLTTLNPNLLRNNEKLESLDIKNNQIKNLDLEHIQKLLPSLKNIDFDKESINCNKTQEVFRYFWEKNVTIGSCKNKTECCSLNNPVNYAVDYFGGKNVWEIIKGPTGYILGAIVVSAGILYKWQKSKSHYV